LEAAWETAERIGRFVGLSPQVEPGLSEVDSGQAAGLPLGVVLAGGPVPIPSTSAIFTPFDGGESYADMHMRTVKALNYLVEAAKGLTIAVVTHPGPIQSFLLAFLRLAIQQRDQLGLSCEPASLHHLQRDHAGYKEIVRLNDTAHLFKMGK
jgi:broad specificity phosphatase PhoE